MRIIAKDEASAVLKGVGNSVSGFGNFMQAAVGPSMALLGAVTAAGAAVGAFGFAAVKASADMEQTRTSFTTLLGSAEAADAMLRDLADFAAKTPFELTGLQDATKRMLAFGFAAEDIIPMMTNIGDAVSALGGGKAEIDRVTLALGQMQAKGKVSAQEMNQLAELGIPAWEMLADAIGTDIPTAMKQAEKGAISSSVAIPAILEGMNKKFAGGMEEQSKTLLGIWSNLQDNLGQVLVQVGDSIMEAFDLKEPLRAVTDGMGAMRRALEEGGLQGAWDNVVPQWLKDALPAIAGAIMLGLVPALVALGGAFLVAAAPLVPFLALGAALGVLLQDELPIAVEMLKIAFQKVMEGDIPGALGVLGSTARFVLGSVWQDIQAFGGQVLQWAIDQLPGLLEQFAQWGGAFLGWAGGVLAELPGRLAEIGGNVASFIGEHIPDLGTWLSSFIDWAGEVWGGLQPKLDDMKGSLLAWIQERVPELQAALRPWAEEFAEWVVPATAQLLGNLETAFHQVNNAVRLQAPNIKAATADLTRALVDWVEENVTPELILKIAFLGPIIAFKLRELANEAAASAIIIGASIVGGILEGLSGLAARLDAQIRGAVGSLHLPTFNVSAVPQGQHGFTNFAGGMAIVGEAGPELVDLPRGAVVHPNERLGRMGGGTTVININVAGNILSEREMLEAVRDGLLRQGVGLRSVGLG